MTTANVLCSHGVVHIVDAVMVPKVSPTLAPAPFPPSMNVVETAMLTFRYWWKLSRKQIWWFQVMDHSHCLPLTNNAFYAMPLVVEGLTKEELQQVSEYHVVNEVAAKSSHVEKQNASVPATLLQSQLGCERARRI